MKAFLKKVLIRIHHFVRTSLNIELPIQQVLHIVMENGFYTPKSTGYSSSFMCHALAHACAAEYITEAEFRQTRQKIAQYLLKFAALGDYLDFKQLPSDFSSRKHIYQNWANRPL